MRPRHESTKAIFDRLTWRDDRMLLDDLVFHVALPRPANWELADDGFLFQKTRGLIDEYARFWSANWSFEAQRIFELGIYHGGSVAFWFECFHPDKHVAIDVSSKGDSRYFQRYRMSRGLEGRIKTYWDTDQADPSALREIVHREFSGPLDLVVDDASHVYEATKASFETLFPFLRADGLYVIEDWNWAYYELAPNHPLASASDLTKLMFEFVDATGSGKLIASLTILPGFAVVERGQTELASSTDFSIQTYVTRRPRFSRARARMIRKLRKPRRMLRRVRRVLSRLVSRRE